MNDKMKQLIEKAARVLKAAGAREVYVFGSAARGAMQEGSDVDIAVSGLPPEIFFKEFNGGYSYEDRSTNLARQ